MIEIRQLKILKAIVDTGSFTRAAEALGISQPAISQQIRALEKELGISVLLRVGRTTRVTAAGDVLVHCARVVLEKLDETLRILEEHGHGRAGVVRIGTSEGPCNYLLPEILVEIKRRFPLVDARVVSGNAAATLGRLAAGDIDVALLALPVDADSVRVHEIGSDELVAVVPPGHSWAGRQYVTARDFEKEPMLVYDRGSQLADRSLRFLLDVGVFPRVPVEIDHLEAVKNLVQQRVGVAMLPRWAIRREVAAGVLLPVRLGPTGLVRRWGVLRLDRQPHSAALRGLLQLFTEMLPALLGPISSEPRGDGGRSAARADRHSEPREFPLQPKPARAS